MDPTSRMSDDMKDTSDLQDLKSILLDAQFLYDITI